MGTPHKGAPDAFEALQIGAVSLPFGLRRAATLQPLKTFPSAYQLLPYPSKFVFDKYGTPIDTCVARDWIEPLHRPLIDVAMQFHRDLEHGRRAKRTHIPLDSIYGIGQRTLTTVHVPNFPHGRRWKLADYRRPKETGDGRVPEPSAKLGRVTPVEQKHAGLFKDRAVREHIKNLLCSPNRVKPGNTRGQRLVPRRHTRIVEMNGGIYTPGSSVRVDVGLVDREGVLVNGARFGVTVRDGNDEAVGSYEVPGTDAHRLTTIEFRVPSVLGGYGIEVSTSSRETGDMEPIYDYFGVMSPPEIPDIEVRTSDIAPF